MPWWMPCGGAGLVGRDADGGRGHDRSEAHPESDACDDRGPQDVREEPAVRTDRAEPGETGRGHEGAEGQQGARGKAGAEPDGERRADDDADGERQHLDPGQRRPVPEHPLQVEGHEVEGRGHGGADQQHVGVGPRHRAVGEQSQPQQRLAGGGPLDLDERGQQGGGDRQGGHGRRRAPGDVVGADDAEDQQCQAGRGQDGAEHVRAAAAGRRRVGGHPPPDHGQRAGGHRHAHEHHPAPAHVLGEQAADQDAERAARRVHRAPDPEGPGAGPAAGEGRGQQRQRRRRQGRGPDTLGGAGGCQVAGFLREASDERGEPEEAEAEHQHPFAAVPVRGLAAQQEQAPEGERVGVDHPGQARRVIAGPGGGARGRHTGDGFSACSGHGSQGVRARQPVGRKYSRRSSRNLLPRMDDRPSSALTRSPSG